MKISHILLVLITTAFVVVTGCGAKKTMVAEQPEYELDGYVLIQNNNPLFPIPKVPASITNEKERAIHLSKHFWDLFSFNDTSLISQPEVTEQGFVDYIHVLNYIPFKYASRSIKYMLLKAQENPDMYAHLASLYQKYYYDADSPFRNEELYMPVLETVLRSGMLPEDEQEMYAFQQEMIHKNRVGTKATDFVYTLPKGNWKRLHSIRSNYVILFFSQPDCPLCETIIDNINNSEVLKPVFSRNSFSRSMLTVLNIYPGSDVLGWRNSVSTMPQKNWINAYDRSRILTNNRVYDIKTIPTIYFLDKRKRIILKDTSLEEIESFFISKE
ncbi:MAG: DUF5106 domain-containing protein [Dysgonamonadaceae bacterium]|nr:DUF5106 domain-containing protein [Dysgonamonadaceae bacterium]MDD4727142.1 DUF5106 domain-containing protein [Dysgonamonadaceae bacterium]